LVYKGAMTTIDAFGSMESWIIEMDNHRLFLNPFYKKWFCYNRVNDCWETTGYGTGEVQFTADGNVLYAKKLPLREEVASDIELAEIAGHKEEMEREGKTWYDSWGWVTSQELKQLEKQAAIYKEEYLKETEELIRKLSVEEPLPTAKGSLCSKCGSTHPMWAKFCNKCGNKFEAPAEIKPEGNKCSKCGNINSAEAKFCNKCGQKTEAKPITRACPVCSDPVAEGETFCTKCGTKIEAGVKAKFCNKCGDPIAENEKFCNKCGWKLT